VWRSQKEHLVEPLRAQADVELLYVLDGATDAFETEMLRIVRQEFRAKALRFVNVTDEQIRSQVAQFVRLQACRGLIEEREAKAGWRYDWLIRTRPDLYFYAGSLRFEGGRMLDGAASSFSQPRSVGRLPVLSELDPRAVHLRMRCYGFPSNSTFTEQHISADNHHVLRRTCGSEPTQCDCRRIQPGCPPGAVRVDDSFAIVPRALMASYFAMHSSSAAASAAAASAAEASAAASAAAAAASSGAASAAHGAPRTETPPLPFSSPKTRDPCPPWQPDGKCLPGCHARPECLMTRTLIEQHGVRISPTPLYFAIARTRGKKWGAGALLNSGSIRTFLSSPLKQGHMDDRAMVAYRCREQLGS
jgi:hypothetical protein